MENQLLDTELNDRPEEWQYASQTKRFINYLIDRVVLYILSSVLQFAMLSTMVENETGMLVASLIVAYGTTIAYYTLMEGAMNGKTIGKFVTGTRAMLEDGTPLTMDKAFMRSLCRIIPFEPFSFLGSSSGWHDTLTRTIVVHES